MLIFFKKKSGIFSIPLFFLKNVSNHVGLAHPRPIATLNRHSAVINNVRLVTNQYQLAIAHTTINHPYYVSGVSTPAGADPLHLCLRSSLGMCQQGYERNDCWHTQFITPLSARPNCHALFGTPQLSRFFRHAPIVTFFSARSNCHVSFGTPQLSYFFRQSIRLPLRVV